MDQVGGQHGRHDVRVVAIAVCEVGSKRPVDQSCGQDRLLRGAALPAEERAGNASDGIHPLLDIDGEREEVGALAQSARSRGGDEDLGVADAYRDGTVGQLGKLAGAEFDLHVSDEPADGGLSQLDLSSM